MGERVLVLPTLSYVGLERPYNFEATARILLNGDLMFRAIFDFNELRVAKMAQSCPSSEILRHRAAQIKGGSGSFG
jgi:hypothetical protein